MPVVVVVEGTHPLVGQPGPVAPVVVVLDRVLTRRGRREQ
jgi:hypothetical protein